MPVRKTITVTQPQDDWIKSRIAAGGFTNDSEYIRSLIRRDQDDSAKIEAIRAALKKGEDSGISDRRPEDIVADARARLKADGKI